MALFLSSWVSSGITYREEAKETFFVLFLVLEFFILGLNNKIKYISYQDIDTFIHNNGASEDKDEQDVRFVKQELGRCW